MERFEDELIQLCKKHSILETMQDSGWDYLSNIYYILLDRWCVQCRLQEEKGITSRDSFDDYAKGYMDACDRLMDDIKNIFKENNVHDKYGILKKDNE